MTSMQDPIGFIVPVNVPIDQSVYIFIEPKVTSYKVLEFRQEFMRIEKGL